jgi:hypothetical protein
VESRMLGKSWSGSQYFTVMRALGEKYAKFMEIRSFEHHLRYYRPDIYAK